MTCVIAYFVLVLQEARTFECFSLDLTTSQSWWKSILSRAVLPSHEIFFIKYFVYLIEACATRVNNEQNICPEFISSIWMMMFFIFIMEDAVLKTKWWEKNLRAELDFFLPVFDFFNRLLTSLFIHNLDDSYLLSNIKIWQSL